MTNAKRALMIAATAATFAASSAVARAYDYGPTDFTVAGHTFPYGVGPGFQNSTDGVTWLCLAPDNSSHLLTCRPQYDTTGARAFRHCVFTAPDCEAKPAPTRPTPVVGEVVGGTVHETVGGGITGQPLQDVPIANDPVVVILRPGEPS